MPSSKSPIWRPYTQERTAAESTKIDRAKGVYLYTDKGQKIIDGISSWWLITHGHCHPEIVEAIQRQASKLDQLTFANFTHEPAEELAEILICITPPELTKVFFSDNGSTAVEVAIKMTLQFCQQSGKTKRTKLVTFDRAYHGDTVGAMSVSGRSAYNAPYAKILFDVIRCHQPTTSSSSVEEWLFDFERVLAEQHEEIAAILIEPLIQGAGGMIMWPLEAVKRIHELCRSYDLILIFDEVMTGFGRTGSLFAMDKAKVVPDILCLSKGLTGGSLPLAVTLASERIFSSFFSAQKSKMLFHGHSFTGNPISCAAAVANVKLFLHGDVHSRLKEIEATHQEQLKNLGSQVLISDPRVCGTIAAFEIGSGEKNYLASSGVDFTTQALQEGLFIRPMGNTFYFMPPYCIERNELVTAWQVLKECLNLNIHTRVLDWLGSEPIFNS